MSDPVMKSRTEVVIENVIGLAFIPLLSAWELMLAVGVIHAEWIPQLPTLGYWWAVLITFLLKGTLSTYRVDPLKRRSS